MSKRNDGGEVDPYSYGSRSYDIVKEFVIALVVVSLLTVGLAAVFSSPDDKSVTVAQWARNDPNGFAATAIAELDGTSGVATYGPPYNSASEGAQLGPLKLQKLAGVRHAIDTAKAFVLRPLAATASDQTVRAALARYNGATADQQAKWTADYETALVDAKGDATKVAAGDSPVPTMITALLGLAQSGAIDGALLSEHGFYQTDYTLPLLFVADAQSDAYLAAAAAKQGVDPPPGYLASIATSGADNLGGDQWGMMNETGSFPGQPWLWLYTMWYQVKPFTTSGNGDALVWGLMMLLTLGLVLLPFIPGLRSIPRWIPVYKLIWRDHYRRQKAGAKS